MPNDRRSKGLDDVLVGRDSRLFGGGHGGWLFGWLFCMNREDVWVDRGGRVDGRTGDGRGIKEIS